ncbi:MAG: hypothetical protein IPM23_04100 [Candidatus Melainabacteria bacterium]|nr:hypothetical protein [Candidatus Melainabacteria bacterium]
MIQEYLAISLLSVLDLYLKTMAAFSSLGDTRDALRKVGQSLAMERWGGYARVWEGSFLICLEVLELVCAVLATIEAEHDWDSVHRPGLRDLLGSLLGTRARFLIVLGNYRKATASYEEARRIFELDRSTVNYQRREAADNSRGTWYRALHESFSDFQRVLERLDGNRHLLSSGSREVTNHDLS